MTRTVTWSDYDHVAMILKFESDPDDVYFVEAVCSGVSLNKWSSVRDHIGLGKFYKMVVFRHIDFNRDSK